MARLLATLQLLLRLTRRDLRGLSSLAFNNLFFCAAFLLQGSHNGRTAFFSTLPFLIVLTVPLLIVLCVDTLSRFPRTRIKLWPLTRSDAVLLRIASLALSPAFWLLGGGLTLWMGSAAGVAFLLVAIVVQLLIALAFYVIQRQPNLSPIQLIPAIPGALGGLLQANLRQLLMSLDLYAGLLLSLGGTLYRFATATPDPNAFPIFAILIALTLSTCAQRAFGLETASSLARYKLLPLKPWRILLAKDLAYLAIVILLSLPLALLPALTFSLIALAIGRYPSLRQAAPQKPWRFTAGDPRFGALQIVLGGLFAIGATRTSPWFLAASFAIYIASLLLGNRWWKPK